MESKEVSKAARREEIQKKLRELDDLEKKPYLSKDGEKESKAKLVRELAELDDIPFSD